MIRRITAVGFICLISLRFANAQVAAPRPVSPDSAKWTSSPAMPGVQAAWLTGALGKPGLYILRVKIKANAVIPPHTHPDERSTTVLAGTVYVGFGEVVDTGKVVAVHAGSVYIVPANMPHYILAKNGDAVYQESGYGPTANQMINSR